MTTRALVLGGGGVTGVAWETGVLAGLAEAGVDLADADLLVGTSAGSVVGAQLATGCHVRELYQAQLAGSGSEIAAKLGPGMLLRWAGAAIRERDPQRFRASVGRLALRAGTVPEQRRLAVIGARLPVHEWPARRLLITAIVAATGEFVVFDAAAGVDLVRAVAASCAVPGVWPPVTIGGTRYIDGGLRSGTNADLAAGHDRVVVIAPVSGGGGPVARLSDQVGALRRTARVVVIRPDRQARRAIGRNVLDPARRGPSARAGLAQAAAVVDEVRAVWAD
jgi:NTE family protein